MSALVKAHELWGGESPWLFLRATHANASLFSFPVWLFPKLAE